MNAPVFVKIENYKQVEETISEIKSKIGEAQRILDKIQSLKTEEEKELAGWQAELRRIEDKIRATEQSLTR